MQTTARAKALARALALGLTTPREVVAWVDNLIVASEKPDHFLTEASLSESNLNKLIPALQRFSENTHIDDETEVWSALIAQLNVWLTAHPGDGLRIAGVLYQMARSGEVPDSEAEDAMYRFEDAYEMAIAGTYGNLDQVEAELREFLDKYGRDREQRSSSFKLDHQRQNL